MIDEPPIHIGLSVDVVDRVERILETLINANTIALGFMSLVMQCDGFVHLSFLVDIG